MKNICKYCKKEFSSKIKTAKFCSILCRNLYYQSDEGKEEQRTRTFNFRKSRNLSCNDILLHKICINCHKEFLTHNPSRKFCNRQCSSFYNGSRSKNRKLSPDTKLKISQGVKFYNKQHHKESKPKTCKICGALKGQCKYPDICKFLKTNSVNKILINFGFDKSKFGNSEIYNEYNKIRNLCYKLYNYDKLSLVEISKKYNISSPSALITAFNNFKIKRRSKSDSLYNAINRGIFIPQFHTLPKNLKSNYHCGWHTTWDNYEVYYRSSNELLMCEKLDNKRIHYDMENLQIPYYHIIEKKMKTAIPDFYIPSLNLIIEIKSYFTYCRGEMISRFKEYKNNGYNYKMIIENKDVGKQLPSTKEIFYDYLKMYNPKIIDIYRNNDI